MATRLIGAALDSFRDAGLEFAALDVDTDNSTGAYRLYESLGFQPWRMTVMYQRELDDRTSDDRRPSNGEGEHLSLIFGPNEVSDTISCSRVVVSKCVGEP